MLFIFAYIYSLISIGICSTVQRLRNQLTSDQANGCSPTLSLSVALALTLLWLDVCGTVRALHNALFERERGRDVCMRRMIVFVHSSRRDTDKHVSYLIAKWHNKVMILIRMMICEHTFALRSAHSLLSLVRQKTATKKQEADEPSVKLCTVRKKVNKILTYLSNSRYTYVQYMYVCSSYLNSLSSGVSIYTIHSTPLFRSV